MPKKLEPLIAGFAASIIIGVLSFLFPKHPQDFG